MSELTPKEMNVVAALCVVGLLAFFFVIFYATTHPNEVTPANSEVREPAYFWEY